MSHFEFVSVAVSLVYALAVSRLLAAAIPAFRKPARDPIHAAWVLLMFFATAFGWWRFWTLHDVSWTGPLFVYALVSAALISLQIGALVGTAPGTTPSFRDLFAANRVLFFSLFGLTCINATLDSWVYGFADWGEPVPYQVIGIAGTAAAAAGMAFESRRAHATIAATFLGLLVFGFLLPLTGGG